MGPVHDAMTESDGSRQAIIRLHLFACIASAESVCAAPEAARRKTPSVEPD